MSKYDTYELQRGESIDKGYCPKCGDVGVLITDTKYSPSKIAILFHLLLCIATLGGWITVWVIWAIINSYNKGNKYCMECNKILQV